MHEASAAESIVRMAEAEAESHSKQWSRGLRVTRIRLVVGETTGYMRESLEFYVGVFARGTCVEGAALDIDYVKPRLKCPACGLEYERRRFSFDCPACGSQGVMTGAGREFYIDSIEVDDVPGAAVYPTREEAP
jgi:hydrogenase nickel incorporation protein HypA/HybF